MKFSVLKSITHRPTVAFLTIGSAILLDHSSLLANSGIHLTPPNGSQFIQILNLELFPACGAAIGNNGFGDPTSAGCKASDGVHTFESLDQGNYSIDAYGVWAQICQAGLNPATFKAACFAKGSDDGLTGAPPAPSGSKAWGVGKLASIRRLPSESNCSDDANVAHLGCVAVGIVQGNQTVFSAMTPGDNCKASIVLNRQVLAAGLDASDISSVKGVVCYVSETAVDSEITTTPVKSTPAPAPQPAKAKGLSCKSTDGYYYLLYDNDREVFVDKYNVKDRSTCARVLAGSQRGLTCKSGSNGEHLIYDYVNQKSIDNYFARTVDECLDGIRINNTRLMCQVNEDGLAAIKTISGGFIDSYFSKTVGQCNQILNWSRGDLTCVSSEDVGGWLGLWNFKKGRMIEGKEVLSFQQCLSELQRN